MSNFNLFTQIVKARKLKRENLKKTEREETK